MRRVMATTCGGYIACQTVRVNSQGRASPRPSRQQTHVCPSRVSTNRTLMPVAARTYECAVLADQRLVCATRDGYQLRRPRPVRRGTHAQLTNRVPQPFRAGCDSRRRHPPNEPDCSSRRPKKPEEARATQAMPRRRSSTPSRSGQPGFTASGNCASSAGINWGRWVEVADRQRTRQAARPGAAERSQRWAAGPHAVDQVVQHCRSRGVAEIVRHHQRR